MARNSVAEGPIQSALVGQLFTTFEVARLCKVSQRTVQIWIRSGELPAVRYGRILRIREADLAAFGQVRTKDAPPRSADASPRE